MSGTYKDPKGKGLEEEEDIDDNQDVRTLLGDQAAHLTYMRDEGVLEGSTIADGDEFLKVGAQNHHRSPSNDHHLKTQISQLQYNNNRIALDRSIQTTVQILGELQVENKERPLFYPSHDLPDELLNSRKAHLALIRKNSIQSVKSIQKQVEEMSNEDSPELKILKLNIKLDNNQISKLDKSAIGQLLDEKIFQISKHLLSLKERIDDTSSKVFVTGDLNSGKSTFCNALLRRKVLPEDQQPCTSVFCEVIDARENSGLEEVHAVTIGNTYNIKDESTYKIYPLKELEDLVSECDKFSILKVYVNDRRTVDQSLLRNGVVDIALIDAPGLNLDSYQTTEVFSRQEEIDLVVFVVSAENHFTLSAKEFIAAAANEKKLIFIVVNRFDNIKDKNKCMTRILDQVQRLSPDTHKDARDFVHFVSSGDVVDHLPNDNGEDPGVGGSGDGDGNGDNNPDDRIHPDFDHLESSLRDFVLQKRALSKLQPAKTYITKLLSDIETLSSINQRMYLNDKDEMTTKLNEISPAYEDSLVKSVKVNEKIESVIEKTSQLVYDITKDNINTTLDNVGDHPIVPYYGILNLVDYTIDTQREITKKILDSVSASEEFARNKTSEGIETIRKYGKDALGEEYNNEKIFKAEFMFSRRKDTISRNLNDNIEISDFFDPSFESFLTVFNFDSKIKEQALVWKDSAYSVGLYAASGALTTGSLIKGVFHYGSFFSFKTLRYLVLPVSIGVGLVSLTYLILDIPRALPRKLAKKIKRQVKELEYPHQNASRISKECRKVLKYPAREVQNSFQTSLDKHVVRKEKILKAIKDADVASAFFGKLLKRSLDQKKLVESFDLEAIATVE
ncbi:Transmembrane GTPase [Wickerhamomyces ciferrii]|uniref:Transmembrane GTPase n=1 Tax=Wickerhamomyces ciferrii (strain ATCC 14091 / BCRC 22168 / CBS 111 / JCM 3599 / NBRC 0793 / NRRL Y-1031 F-60-10) TaxID=1206466 RepID=K0KV55_WICCF|nr:Transmembrane GTPase [Wickerhamomyces ciferrii]CCH45053.1 Transmembrane GTPase [Wickerhamomyces ciferrii]